MTQLLNDRLMKKATLLNHINSLREQMIHTGLRDGLNNEKTISLSQQLDEYIYLYQSFEKSIQP